MADLKVLDTDTALKALELTQQIAELTATIENNQAVIDEYSTKTYKANDTKLKGQKYSIGEINSRRKARILNITAIELDQAITAKAELEARLKALILTADYVTNSTPDPTFDPFALFN